MADIVAFAVGHGAGDDGALVKLVGEPGAGIFDLKPDFPADKAKARIANQGAGQEACLGEDLEAVTDAKNPETFQSFGSYVCHNRRTGRDGPAAQVIAIGKAARNNREVDIREVCFGVPDKDWLCAGDSRKGSHHVGFAVEAGEEDDRGFHE